MSRVSTTLVFSVFAAFVALICGYWLQLSDPDGIWLYTPSADGSGKPSDALYVGAALGCLIIAAGYLVAAIGVFFWGKFRIRSIPNLFWPLVASALIAFTLAVALSAGWR